MSALPWRDSLCYCVESTSISSIAIRIPGGMDSDRIVEVEALCRDGFRDPSDTADEDGGFYSMMGDADID